MKRSENAGAQHDWVRYNRHCDVSAVYQLSMAIAARPRVCWLAPARMPPRSVLLGQRSPWRELGAHRRGMHPMVTLIGHRLHELRRRGTHLGHNNFSTFGVDGQRPVVERRFHLLPWPSPAVTPRSGPMPSGTRVRFKSIDSERRHMGIGSGASERELSTALP